MTLRGRRLRARLTYAAVLLLLAVGGLFLAIAIDEEVYDHFDSRPWSRVTDREQMFRMAGYLPFWLLASAALLLVDWSTLGRHGRAVWRRAALLAMTATISGAMSEVLKLLIRRERPPLDDGEYVFRPWSERTLEAAGLGMPSGHTSVAVAAACALCLLWPRAAPIWLLAAVGCAYGRVARCAHFVSDVWLAMVVGIVVEAIMWRWLGYRRREFGGVR